MSKKFSLAEVVSAISNDTSSQADKAGYDSDETEFETLQDAADAVGGSSGSGQVDVIILPPSTVDGLSDEEVMDDDNLAPQTLPADIPGRIAVRFHGDNLNEDDDEDPTDASPAKKRKRCNPKSEQKRRTVEKPIKWGKKVVYTRQIPESPSHDIRSTCPELVDKTPYELFRFYYDDDIRDLIVTESNRYASQKNKMTFNLLPSEMDIFIGTLLLSRYHSLPRERMYWCRDDDIAIPFINSRMSRNRFTEIKRYLHLADNDHVDPTDKMFKVRPLVSALNTRFQQFGIFSKYLSIDEEMIPYYGHHSAKMFIRGKPIRFGFKLWVLASDDGYPYNIQVYCGKNGGPDDQGYEGQGVGHRVVMSLLQCVDFPQCHEVYFDNFFTSYELLVALKEANIKATGTVRENRLKNSQLMLDKAMKKTERGTFDIKCDKNVMAVKWHDNKCVTVATNHSTVEPLGKAKRWNKTKKAMVDVPQPKVIGTYNAHMGGVDILDRFLSNYRPIFRAKKWWWPIFLNSINMMVVAAWRLHVGLGGSHDQLSFRRNVVCALLSSCPDARSGETGVGRKPVMELRTDHVDHHMVANSKQARCRWCQRNSRLKCSKCDVPLHLHCEAAYHRM